MRSQLITVMAPEDEDAFLRFVFETPTVVLIPEVRNASAAIPTTRGLPLVASDHCYLWDRAILQAPRAEFIPTCNDFYLRSEESLIQFLRSPQTATTIGAGRIALATGSKGESAANPSTAGAMEAWFKRLVKWLK